RGITEGEFTRRMPGIILTMPSEEIDLNKPPFNGPGAWRKTDNGNFELFGQNLSVGAVILKLNQAELADPQVAKQVRGGHPTPIKVRFDVLDHQATFRFENYASLPREQLIQQLEQFKKELSREEPRELVELIVEPLTLDVQSKEASLIAMGWTQYNRLPDRYCTQEPVLDSSANAWRVSITFGYPTGQSGEVGELLIDVKTGKIISHTPIEELRDR